MTEKTFDFQPGDIILIKTDKKLKWRLFGWIVKGFWHCTFYYDKTKRGVPLCIESSTKGTQISTMKKRGEEVEVYRLDHRYAEAFNQAILKAAEELVDDDFAFFDYFVIFKLILRVLRIPSRFISKYLPFLSCSDLLQVCYERAPKYLSADLIRDCYGLMAEYLGEDLKDVFGKEVLVHFPPYIMLPADFKKIPVLKKVWEGRI